MSAAHFAIVALPLPFKFHSGGFEGLTYSIPEEVLPYAKTGMRVLVPLGKRQVTGVIVEITSSKQEGITGIRPLIDILDTEQVFDDNFLHWTKWIASYYLCSWGEVLEAALPQGLRVETKQKVTAVEDLSIEDIGRITRSSKKRAEVFKTIAAYKNGVFISHLTKRTKLTGIYAHIRWLEENGFVTIASEQSSIGKIKKERVGVLAEALHNDPASLSAALMELERSPKQAKVLLKVMEQHQLHPQEPHSLKLLASETAVTDSVIQSLIKKGFITVELREVRPQVVPSSAKPASNNHIALTSEQQAASATIATALDEHKAKTFLLHGVTGSGKTEVYIDLARKVLAEGGGVLVLVPEISLTPQLIDRFKKRFEAVGVTNFSVLHSRMSLAERYASWKALASGETKIAIGARSAVFAPIKGLRLIVVDEEHEMTYKQYDKTPRYNARDAAVMRAHLLGGVCVLGSATPSLESYYNATQGKYELLTLASRAQAAALPPVRIVDLRRPPARKEQLAKLSSISIPLREAIGIRLLKKQGTVLLQNRRGFSTYLSCSNCGDSVLCPNCAVTLTWHREENRLQCHYCGFMSYKPETCPTCGSEKLFFGGVGTERVEDELKQYFPEIRIARMDLDTTAKRGSFEQLLRSFASGETDVLLGTQMVAKGLDFARVTLVGVINADTSLCLPDFRSSERTFQLLTQVSGRAGRTEELAGEVIVQTYQPDHPSVVFASKHDYNSFYEKEIAERETSKYPPFIRLILVEFKGANAKSVAEAAKGFIALLPKTSSFYTVLGPAEPAIKKLRGEFRYHILFKDDRQHDGSGEKMRRLLTGAMDLYQKKYANRAVTVTIDVDVQGVL